MMGGDRRGWVLLVLAAMMLVTPAWAGGGDADLFLGQRRVSDDTLEDLNTDEPSQIGVLVSLDFDWPVVLALDLMSSSDDSTLTDTEGQISSKLMTDLDILEFNVGVRKLWGKKARPYVGGGLAVARVEGQIVEQFSFGGDPADPFTILDDSDTGFGYFLDAGFKYTFFRHFNLGIDLRYSDASVTLQGTPLGPGEEGPKVDVEGGGTQVGVLLGFRWGL
jgi:opacity protein-like surface antigen